MPIDPMQDPLEPEIPQQEDPVVAPILPELPEPDEAPEDPEDDPFDNGNFPI